MSENREESNRPRWDARAVEKGDSLEGVLYRGLPDALNQYIHEFHTGLVLHKFLPHIPTGGRVLDLGCGFGRVSVPVAEARDDIALVGADFSMSYCAMYAARTGQAVVCADIATLPFRNGLFDGIVAVTSLMYVAEEDRDRVFQSVNQLLKPGGFGLYIDPGREFKWLAGALRPSTRSTPTGGYAFSAREYASLSQRQSRVVDYGGMPGFSSLFPALYVTSGRRGLFKAVQKGARFLDRKLPRWWRLTLHRWVLVQRPALDQTGDPYAP